MSGLLDKANESAKTVEDVPEDEASDAVLDIFPDESSSNGLNTQKLQFQLGSLVVLIVTYGCELWSIITRNLTTTQHDAFHKDHMRRELCVSRLCPNDLLYIMNGEILCHTKYGSVDLRSLYRV